jgi:hypothetical protein
MKMGVKEFEELDNAIQQTGALLSAVMDKLSSLNDTVIKLSEQQLKLIKISNAINVVQTDIKLPEKEGV